MIYVFPHLTNAIFVILKQIADASLKMNSIDFPPSSFWFSLSKGYYLIRSEEGSVRYLPCLRLRFVLPQSLTWNTNHLAEPIAVTNCLTSIKYDIYMNTFPPNPLTPCFFFLPLLLQSPYSKIRLKFCSPLKNIEHSVLKWYHFN